MPVKKIFIVEKVVVGDELHDLLVGGSTGQDAQSGVRDLAETQS